MATAKQIKAARERLGETQAEFAKRFGVNQSTIDRWENDGPPSRGPGRVAIDLVLAEISDAEAAS